MAPVTASEAAKAQLQIFGIVRDDANSRPRTSHQERCIAEGDNPMPRGRATAKSARSRAAWDCCTKREVNSFQGQILPEPDSAFLKGNLEGCKYDNCTAELSLQLAVLFATFVSLNAVEIGIPLLKKWKAEREQEGEKSQLETEVDMAPTSVLGDYQELMVCFGFLTLFCGSLPIAPLFAIVAVRIELWVDAQKYTKLSQRPFPAQAADVGIWGPIINFLAITAVITNLGLIMLTDNKFGLDSELYWGIFILAEHMVLLMVWVIGEAIPDATQDATDLKKRQNVIVSEKYYGIEDDD